MILQFAVSNYRAFRKMQTLSLAATNYDKKTLPQNCVASNLPGLKNQKWLKGAALYGPNASGKSTMLDALETMREMVVNSAKATDEREPIDNMDAFALDPGKPELPTGFGVVFVMDEKRYEYRFAATRERIWHESLRTFPRGAEQLWFSRDWQPKEKQYRWGPKTSSAYSRDPHKISYTLSNTLYLSRAISLDGDKQLDPVFRWFKDRLHYIDLSAKGRGIHEHFTASQFLRRTELVPGILELLRKADLGITSARVTEEKLNAEMLAQLEKMLPSSARGRIVNPFLHRIELAHRGPEDSNTHLLWGSESTGTRRLFSLAGPWLDILANGYAVCIDEIETSMHPLMVVELLKLFFSEEHNKKGAQIIFTTHNPLLLDPALMRRDQIWFTDKNDSGEASLYPLTDYQPRKNESLTRGYLSGRYGAVPFIPDGLLESLRKD